MNEKQKEFVQKLNNLLKEYNASIGFTCSSCSDTYGINGESVAVTFEDKETRKQEMITLSEGWWHYPE